MRLEVHSHFTLLGGTAPVEALAAHAAEEGMSHLALTDHQALYGAVAFARVCRRFSVRPITGMSVDMALPGETTVSGGQRGRLVLLAKNARGIAVYATSLPGCKAIRDAKPACARGWRGSYSPNTARDCCASKAVNPAGYSICCVQAVKGWLLRPRRRSSRQSHPRSAWPGKRTSWANR